MAKLLIVEDNEGARSLIEDYLEMGGYEHVSAFNGEDGLNALAQHDDIAAVLLDHDMPVMNGFDAGTRMRELYPNMPILGIGDHPKDVPYLNDSLSKPIPSTQLLAMVQKYVEQ